MQRLASQIVSFIKKTPVIDLRKNFNILCSGIATEILSLVFGRLSRLRFSFFFQQNNG